MLLATAGSRARTKIALAEGRRLNPNHTLKQMVETGPNLPRLYEGLRKAGLPEQ